jgi:sialidase-1
VNSPRLLALALASTTAVLAAPVLTHTDVFVSGQNGYHTFRIPGLETAPDGSLIAFAEARKYTPEDPGFGKQDIDLVYKRSTDNGATWSPMVVLEDPGEEWAAANPATLVDRSNGKLWVFYIRSRPGRSSYTARPGTDDMANKARWSADNGRTWSEAIDMTASSRDMQDPKWNVSVPGPGGAIQTSKGRLLIAMWEMPYAVFSVYSDDHGQTWHRGQKVQGPRAPLNASECQVAELNDGRILLDMRQDTEPHRWLAESTDGGATWGTPRPGITVTAVACALERYTPTGATRSRLLWTGPKGPARKHLVLRTSTDEGKTFGQEKTLSTDFAAYSETAVLKDNSVGILWERGTEKSYQFITFSRVNQEWLAP